MKFSDLSLKNKLLFTVLPIVIVAVAVLALVFYDSASSNIVQLQKESMKKLVDKTMVELDNWLVDRKEIAVLLSETESFKAACRGERLDEAKAFLGKQLSKLSMYENFFLATPDGQLFMIAKGDASKINLSQIPIYKENAQKARQGEVWISDVGKSPVSGRPVALVTAPIFDGREVIGIMGTPVELNDFSDKYISGTVIGKTGYLYMLDSQGITLAHPDKKNILEVNFSDFEFGQDMLRQKSGLLEYVWDGKDKIAVFDQHDESGWMVAGTEFKEVFIAPVRSMASKAWVLGFISVLLISAVLWIIAGSVARVIARVVESLKDIAEGEGDLTKRVDISSRDEIGMLAMWFNTFLDKLQDIIRQVRSNTEEVATAANEISSTSTQFAAGAEEQSQQSVEVASSVQQMSAAIIENSQNASETAGLAEAASQKAQEGVQMMGTTRQGMADIVASASKTGEIVQSLAGRAGQIDAIIQVIDDIADQTNLLALNAAIEAARAGEQGRGFAVVADEVRKLAERTTKATGEISETIKAIQVDTQDASDSMVEAGDAVSAGQESIEKTGQVLDDIASSVEGAMEMIRQIATASEEQSSTAEQISQSIDAISTVAHQSASGAEEMAASSEELNRQTESLRTLVARFKLDD